MAERTTSLDWTDVAMMMSAISTMHTCRVEWTATTVGKGHSGHMHISLWATFDVVPNSDLPRIVSVSGQWPSSQARSFEGLIYNLLWQLDYAIGQAYEQMTISDS